MLPWLHFGRRFEYTFTAGALGCFLVGGFALSRTAPPEIRWFVWLFVAGLVFPMFFVGWLLGRRIRQRHTKPLVPPAAAAKGHPAKTRLLFYLSIVVVMVPADRVLAKALGISLIRLLPWDAAVFAVLIATSEVTAWRKRRLIGN